MIHEIQKNARGLNKNFMAVAKSGKGGSEE
jgi:hypothetical protein